VPHLRPPFEPLLDEGPEVKVLGGMRTRGVGFVLRKQTEEVAVQGFLDGLFQFSRAEAHGPATGPTEVA
jgi:hypothetical protein